MTNISTAKSSLRAELAHVQSGLDYYQSRVEALNAAIEQLDAIDEKSDSKIEPEIKRGKGRPKLNASAKRAGGRKAAMPGRQAKSGSRLPATGGDFFPKLLSDQRQSMADLLHAAAEQLPFRATTDELSQLRSRLVAAMMTMLKSGKALDEGKGRERVYFKP